VSAPTLTDWLRARDDTALAALLAHRPDLATPVPADTSVLAADRQGALSPFGDVTFPLPADELGYEHPVTQINK